MIKYTDDIEQIIQLWQEAFGDSEEEIRFFDAKCENKRCLGYFNEDTLEAMMYLVECICDGKRSYYVYAACTRKESRGKGYMTALLDYCKENIFTFCLIPASYYLVKFYFDRGLKTKTSLDSLYFYEIDEIKEYLFDGCRLKKPFVLKYK